MWAEGSFAAENAKGRRIRGVLLMLPVTDEPVILKDQVVNITDIGHLHLHGGILLCVWGFTQYMRNGGKNCTESGSRRKMSQDSFGFFHARS